MDRLVSLCKRRGFVFQSSEIYGGVGSTWDYGPLGVEMKRAIRDFWWESMVRRDDIEGLDAAILMHPRVWEASGHVAGFTDPLVDCRNCKHRFRADVLEGTDDPYCPRCGSRDLSEARQFNLMFKTFMGPVEEEASVAYLRPETAQGIDVNFQNVLNSSRQKIPFGIAQIGKAFRNEITPGNFIFRTREFEQMEMQFFVKPGDDREWLERWLNTRRAWYRELGIRDDKLRVHEHGPDELAHYAAAAFDIQYEFPFGWQELEGIHDRTDFDLTRHEEHSGKKLSYFDEESKERYVPYIVETSAGVDRTMLMCLVDGFREEGEGKEARTVLKLSPRIAPIKLAVFPLVKRDGMPELASEIYRGLGRRWNVFYDDGGSIGRRYRRQDEAGTPFCVTVDGESVSERTVTVRDRDTMEQARVPVDRLEEWLAERLSADRAKL
ncbi:MAG TPA: glycine--tRNA ligase [Gemmatimonadota bacterium]|nr:glycine--tRNA ligase [Gemmatimonadota bacterium]